MKKYNFKIAIYIIIGFINTPAITQNLNVSGIFPTVDHSGKISTKLDYSLYYFGAFPIININNPNIIKDSYFNLFYAEQALTYKLNSNFSLTGSYLFQRANVVYNNFVNENRFYTQAKYKHSINKFNFTHRFRFDGRFIHDRIKKETPFTHRLRYQLGLDFSLSENLYFTAYEEVFFNTFKASEKIFGENWAYVGVGKKINEKNKIELGLLYITWNLNQKNWFNQFYGQITWINNIDFQKK